MLNFKKILLNTVLTILTCSNLLASDQSISSKIVIFSLIRNVNTSCHLLKNETTLTTKNLDSLPIILTDDHFHLNEDLSEHSKKIKIDEPIIISKYDAHHKDLKISNRKQVKKSYYDKHFAAKRHNFKTY